MTKEMHMMAQERFTELVHGRGLCWVDAMDVVMIEVLCA